MNLLGNPYVLIGALILGFILGFGICWPIGTYRVDKVQIINFQTIIDQQKQAIKEQTDTLKNWQEQAQKNALDAQQIIEEQRQINDAASKAQVNLQNSIVGIQNVARNLPPLNCKLDGGYQQLLYDISQTANGNTSYSPSTKTTVAPRNSKLHSTLPKSQN